MHKVRLDTIFKMLIELYIIWYIEMLLCIFKMPLASIGLMSGFAPPSSTFQIDDKNKIAVDLAKHFIIYSSKAELDQFQSGLETLDTLNFMKKHAVTIK